METTEIYKRMIEKFGKEAQTIVAIEELSELQKELCKHLRGQTNFENIIEEIADVKIMLAQLELIFDCDLLVIQEMAKKLQRTEERYLK
jgi:NTP pyrophosphatase (non-canonical NTP hydrolase)